MEKEPALLKENSITPEGIESLRQRIGVQLRLPPAFNETAVRESIRKFADGVGDLNPLFRDEEHASQSRYGNLIAPPSFLYSVYPTLQQVGLPGVHGFHAGNDWEFFKPVRVNDLITARCTITGVEEKVSKFSGKIIIVHFAAEYLHEGEVIARAKAWTVRAERRAAREKGKYASIQLPHPWEQSEIEKIEQDILKEKNNIRGKELRYWEDVQVGDELPPIIRGPLNLLDELAFCVAGAFPVRIQAYPAALEFYGRHPDWVYRNPDSGALEPAFLVHFSIDAAKSAGLPYPYDIGVQRNIWLITLLTNWMGDDGFLKQCFAEYRRFFYFSDVIWIKGKVIEKINKNGEFAVKIETSAVNQRGEDTMPGWAIVSLPSRTGYHPLAANPG